MSHEMLSQFKYNHPVSFKYAFSSLGFDMYQATYESSIPNKPFKICLGKWYIDARVFKWQLLVNKMTKQQLAISLYNQKQNTQNESFNTPTFGF